MAKKKGRKRQGVEGPTSDCVLLCDDVLISKGKNKHSLMGVIGTIGVVELPAVLSGYVAYARFSNVYGGKVSLKLVRARDEETIFEAEFEFPSQSDPLGVYTLVIPVIPFRVDEPGRYLFGAYHHDVPIATSPILVKALALAPRKEPPPEAS